MTVGERIKIARRAANLSQKELGEKIGMSQAMVAQHETGRRKPKLSTIKQYARVLDIGISDIAPDVTNADTPMNCRDFYRAMKAHCIHMNAKCENCCMRMYCYTPPCERTDFMMENVISFLAIENDCTGSESHSDHRTETVQMPCPCNMDMSTALGYEPR